MCISPHSSRNKAIQLKTIIVMMMMMMMMIYSVSTKKPSQAQRHQTLNALIFGPAI